MIGQKVIDILQKQDISQKTTYLFLEQEFLEALISETIRIFNTILSIDKKNLNPILEEIKRVNILFRADFCYNFPLFIRFIQGL